MPDKNRKLIEDFKALGAPFAAPQPRPSRVSQFEKDYREMLANQQAAREQLTSDLVSPSRIANAVVPGAVGALTGYGSQILGAPGDIVGLYEEFKPESWASAPTSLQSLPSTEQVQQLFAPAPDSFIGRRRPEYEAGITGGNLYALGEGVAALPGLARGVGRGAKALGKEAARRIDEAMLTGEGALGKALAPARPAFVKETGGRGRYETKQEGPFYRVNPRIAQEAGSTNLGIREQVRPSDIAAGSGGGNVPQPISDEEIGLLIRDPSNFVSQTANAYTQGVSGKGYGLPEMPESSLAKQSAIGRVFQLAASDNNAYKQAVFEAYGRKYPKLVQSTGAQNYDQLMEAAYRQLAKETADQFHKLPVRMSYHKQGEGNYQNSGELLRDIYGNRHMYVYQGGDPHDFLNVIDPETGLNTNEMFRAVHDFYGHAVHGNPFGPKGEEIAYGAHSQMFSPLARMAMAGETRGQNSFVNYTPINAQLKQRINRLNEAKYEAARRGDGAEVHEIENDLKDAWQGFQFAPQKSVLLPPEFLETSYTGGMPSWVSPLIVPEPGTTSSEMLTHFSHRPDLTFLDPKKYGTGIKGAEMSRLRSAENPVMERAYAYTGDPALVKPEKGLGSHRYGTMGSGLYNLSTDPLAFNPLAIEANRVPWTSQVNRGVVRAPQAEADVERMIKEYGYSGMVNPDLGMAILYNPTPVSPFAKGGTVSRDAMQMAAWNKQVQHKGMGGWMKGAGRTAEEAKRLFEIAKGTRAKAAQVEAGLYHPIGGGVKLSKPIQLMEFETVKDPTVKGVKRKIVTLEDLQGGIAIPLVGDRAAGGKLLTSVEGTQFRNPLALEAGPDYMLTHTIPGSPESSIWRSGKGVISGLQNQVEFARDTGRPIYGVNVVGAPTNVNFNTMVTEAILNQYDPTALTKKAKQAFLKDIRNYVPDPKKPHLKPGAVLTEADLNDVEALRAKMLAEGAGPLRKAFVERMGQTHFQEAGFPDVPAARLATTEPALVDVPTGSAGFTIGEIDPAARALAQTPRGHKTYPVALAGEYFGSLDRPIDYRDIFQEFADKRRLFGKPEGADWRSFDLSPQFQTLDQEWLDRVMKSAGADKPREWKQGGPVHKAEGGMSSDDLIIEERPL